MTHKVVEQPKDPASPARPYNLWYFLTKLYVIAKYNFYGSDFRD